MNADNRNLPQRSVRGISGVNVLLGIWILISPFVLAFGQLPNAMWNNVIVGALIAIFALVRLSVPHTSWSWVNSLLGLWLIISPFVLGFAGYGTALWNNIILGAIVALISWSSAAERSHVTQQMPH